MDTCSFVVAHTSLQTLVKSGYGVSNQEELSKDTDVDMLSHKSFGNVHRHQQLLTQTHRESET
jgi:hypothetical protein